MVSLQHIDAMLFQKPSILQKDLISDDHTKSSKKRQRKSKISLQENQYEETNQKKLKKVMHRDVERQRRQEMTSLYASLRTLLPLEYIKGRRSICDHMHEAVNYIKHMERKIKDLQMQRDKLKNVLPVSAGSDNRSSSSVNLPNCVMVNCSRDGVVILINCGSKNGDGFPLSTVLIHLLVTGFNVVSCVCTKVNERFLYRIQTEVDTLAYINLPQMQERLLNVIN